MPVNVTLLVVLVVFFAVWMLVVGIVLGHKREQPVEAKPRPLRRAA